MGYKPLLFASPDTAAKNDGPCKTKFHFWWNTFRPSSLDVTAGFLRHVEIGDFKMNSIIYLVGLVVVVLFVLSFLGLH
jgi:hypothetical protein